MLAFARETRLSRDDLRPVRRRPPAPTTGTASGRWAARSRSPGTRRSAPRWPSRARAASPASYVQETPPACSRSTSSSPARPRSASMLQEPPRSGPSSIPPRRSPRRPRRLRRRSGRCRAQVVSTGVAAADRAACATPRRWPRARPTTTRSAAARPPTTRSCSTSWRSTGGRARARSFLALGRGRGPRHRLRRRPAVRLRRPAHRLAAVEIDQGVEMGRASRLRAIEDDRVRVGGDASWSSRPAPSFWTSDRSVPRAPDRATRADPVPPSRPISGREWSRCQARHSRTGRTCRTAPRDGISCPELPVPSGTGFAPRAARVAAARPVSSSFSM